METKALKRTIEFSFRFTDFISRKVLYIPSISDEHKTVLKLAAMFQSQCFAVASEFIINTTFEAEHSQVYLLKVKTMLGSMFVVPGPLLSATDSADEAKRKCLAVYDGAVLRFIFTFDKLVKPYYDGPTRLREISEEIEQRKELAALRGNLTPEAADEINAKLVFVQHSGLLEALQGIYNRRSKNPKKIHLATGLAYLIKEPGSVEYIYRLLANLEANDYNARRNNPYSLDSVESANLIFEKAKLPAGDVFETIHKALVRKKTTGPQKRKSGNSGSKKSGA